MNAPVTKGQSQPSLPAGEGAGEAAMLDTVERLGSWRTNGKYTVRRTHNLTGVSQPSIKDWLRNYPDSVAALKPPWEDMSGRVRHQESRLSFLELVDILVAGKFRAASGKSYKKVREYHDDLVPELGTQFPFAHQDMLTRKDQLPASVADVLEQLDYEECFASRWCPLGKEQPIAVDPRRGSGAPTIKGRRLRVEDIRGYFVAGESIEFLSSDFDLEPIEVETVLRYAFLTAT